jgi:hypothetical protein
MSFESVIATLLYEFLACWVINLSALSYTWIGKIDLHLLNSQTMQSDVHLTRAWRLDKFGPYLVFENLSVMNCYPGNMNDPAPKIVTLQICLQTHLKKWLKCFWLNLVIYEEFHQITLHRQYLQNSNCTHTMVPDTKCHFFSKPALPVRQFSVMFSFQHQQITKKQFSFHGDNINLFGVLR